MEQMVPTTTRPTLSGAVRALAGVCDGAHARDDVGFNGVDATIGRDLARTPEEVWDDATRRFAWEMLRKYARQLSAMGIDFEAIPEPPLSTNNTTRAEAVARSTRTVTAEDGRFVIRFRYDPSVVEAVRRIPGRRWAPEDKCWAAPLTSVVEVREFADRNGFALVGDIPEVEPVADRPVEAHPPSPPSGSGARIWVQGTKFVIQTPYNPKAVAVIRQMPGREWHPKDRVWKVPVATGEEAVLRFAEEFEIPVDEGVLDKMRQTQAEAAELRAASRATDADIVVEGLGDGLALDPFQRAGVAYAARTKRCFIADEMGLGKFHPLDEPVLTPHGWRKIGELEVGDQVVGQNGKPTDVTGVFPQGVQEIVRVTMSDGSSTDCGWDHLWCVQHVRNDGPHRYPGRFEHGLPEGRWRVMTTREIAESVVDGAGNRNWRIPMVEPVCYEPCDPLPLDPYVLGVWLGNGSRGSVTLNVEDAEDVGRYFEGGTVRKGTTGTSWRGRVSEEDRRALGVLGIFGKRSWEKSIPTAYLRADPMERLALLQGLMDSDGHAKGDGGTEFSSTSEAMADGVVELARSLGGVARKKGPRTTRYTHDGERREGRRSWRVNVKLPHGYAPFRSVRKSAAWVAPTKYPVTRVVAAIEPIGSAEAVCIAVEAPDSLYVTRDYIVTHNTIQALAAAQYTGSFPMLVVCPPSLLLNWLYEVQRWLPGKTVQVLTGTKPHGIGGLIPPDVVIIGYSVMSAWAVTLREFGFKALVLDESTNIKNPKAQRTQAVLSLRDSIPPDGLVLALTGTPLLNRADELITQLEIIGRIGEFGSPSRFKRRYCRDTIYLPELHDRLRATCYVRRLKADVLTELPPKRRATVPAALDGGIMKEYAEAEADVARYLAERAREWALESGADDIEAQRAYWQKKMRASAAEQLVLIGTLKELIAKAKLDGAVEWVRTFLASTDKKLVIFADRIFAQQALAERIAEFASVVTIEGGQKKELLEENKRRFQEDAEVRVIVCSLTAGGMGHTLTAASDVAFLEQGWTPATHMQAEDRCHRRGQRDSVNAWYLLASGTIDDYVSNLLREKMAVVDAATDGKVSDDEESGSVLGDVLVYLANKGGAA